MAKFTEVRLTLAAFIYGIEIDLKTQIKKYLTPFFNDLSFFQNAELETKIKLRYLKENPNSDISSNLDEVIDFLDFQDTFVILSQNSSFIPKNIYDEIKLHYNILSDITPIRNRVMHTRPLLGGDFILVYDFVTNLKKSDSIVWSVTLETREKIEKDPTYVLTLTIPFPNNDYNKVIHNLPIPDFDETGFIGRKKDADDIKKLILSNKVVSIIGDGGIGKTALALKVIYDIIDMNEKCPFELIIWTSAKTTMLTAKGIEDINNALKDFTGFINAITDTFGSNKSNTQLQIEEILEYLSSFKTLLVIDNLETIQTEEVREFIREAQMRCHIVITSRIGLGELEFPRKLTGLSENEAVSLIREIARIRNSDTLLKLPQSTLIEVASKLYYNPLGIKWFVNTVQTGISPTEVLTINKFEDLLNFCLTNVYTQLSQGSIQILDTIRAARKNLNTAEIIYLSGMLPIDVRKFINELFTTTLVSRDLSNKNNLEEMTYYVTDFAKDFMLKHHPLKSDVIRIITNKLNELTQSISQLKHTNEFSEFSINAISFRTPNEKIAAKFLTEALQFSKSENYTAALEKVEEAKAIVPNYFEAYRVGAFIKATMEDILGAEEDYKTGLEIEPENVRLLFYYSQLLLFQFSDAEKAFIYADKVYKIKPEHPYTAFLISRCLSRLNKNLDAVKIIEALLKTNLENKDIRIAYTELISFHTNLAKNAINIENDYIKGINYFKQGLKYFDICAESRNVDTKLIKNYCEGLNVLLSVLSPTSLTDTDFVTYLKEIVVKYDTYISTNFTKEKIVAKLIDKFGADGIENINIQNIESTTKLIGNVSRKIEDLAKHFVFIQHQQRSYYANKYDFIDINTWDEWRQLKDGQLVKFELGENSQGICAKRIELLIKND